MFLSTLVIKITWWLNILIQKLLYTYLASFEGNLQTFYINAVAGCRTVILNLIYNKLMNLFFQ